MKLRLLLVPLFLLPAAAPVLANSTLDGTWKMDPNSVAIPPTEYVVENGTFSCKPCALKAPLIADGQDHPVSGLPYFDTIAVKLVDAHTVEGTNKKAGKILHTDNYVVSADGLSLIYAYTDSTSSSGDTTTGTFRFKRVAPGAAGAHALSGTWQYVSTISASDNGLMVSYSSKGDMLSMTSPTGQSFSAKLDGTVAPYQGDPGQDHISMKQVSERTFTETDLMGDKVLATATYTVAGDGKTAQVDINDKRSGQTARYLMTKQ